MKYQTINEARMVLELPETASMEQIKRNYRRLVNRWHPDHCNDSPERCKEMAQKITEAYRIILDYCANYRYSFTQEEVDKYLSEEEWWYQRYGTDPIWGNY